MIFTTQGRPSEDSLPFSLIPGEFLQGIDPEGVGPSRPDGSVRAAGGADRDDLGSIAEFHDGDIHIFFIDICPVAVNDEFTEGIYKNSLDSGIFFPEKIAVIIR